MKSVKQFTVATYDKPGVLGKLSDTLGKAGINLLAITTEASGTTAFIHFIAEPEAKVGPVLAKSGYTVFETLAALVEVPNNPGELGRLSQELGKQGVNIQAVYGTSSGKQGAALVFVVDNWDKAKKAFESALVKAA